MKKSALVLGLFTMVLSAGISFAACPCSMPSNDCSPCAAAPCTSCEKPKDDCGCNPCKPKCDVCKGCPDLSECWTTQREKIYQRLKLNCNQLEKARCLDNNYKNKFDNIKDEMKCQKDKLCDLINACACKDDKQMVKDRIKELKKDMKSNIKCYDKDFKCILDKCQMKQYRQIKREYKKQMREYRKAGCWCKH